MSANHKGQSSKSQRLKFNVQTSKSKPLHAYRSHSAIQSQPFYAVISVFLHGNISHFAMLSQSYWFACAVLLPPTNVTCDTRDMFFGFVCMQRYKILQAIARLSQIFYDPYGPHCFLSTKAETTAATLSTSFSSSFFSLDHFS